MSYVLFKNIVTIEGYLLALDTDGYVWKKAFDSDGHEGEWRLIDHPGVCLRCGGKRVLVESTNTLNEEGQLLVRDIACPACCGGPLKY